jgi:hypothetical protein
MMSSQTHTAFKMSRKSLATLYRTATIGFRALPDFIIIGTQRGGTTSLYNYLIQHPAIAPAARKEVHYFDANIRRGPAWYRTHFPAALSGTGRKLTGEGTPYYLFHPCVPQRVHDLLPAVKLIVLLRNPVDRAYSHYQHEVRHGRESLTFEHAILAEQQRLSGEEDRLVSDPAYSSTPHQRHSYLARGIYCDQIARWQQTFSLGRMLIVRSEDFYGDPGRLTNDVLEFLGLSPIRIPTHRQYQAGEYAKMPSRLRQRLLDYFMPHNERLRILLNRDFRWNS